MFKPLVSLPCLPIGNLVPILTAEATMLEVATGMVAMVALIRLAVEGEARVQVGLEAS